MKDNEIRGIVLRYFYERRYEGYRQWKSEDIQKLGNGLTDKMVYAICDQLSDHDLIHWKPLILAGRTANGTGKITAFGVDVIEGETKAPISIILSQAPNITVTGSSNVQIGNSNSQSVGIVIGELMNAINNSTVKESEKEEARSLLRSFLAHPLVSAIIGGLTSTI